VLMELMQLLEALHYMQLTKSLLMCACSFKIYTQNKLC
jgi:hypothetical protein